MNLQGLDISLFWQILANFYYFLRFCQMELEMCNLNLVEK